MTKLDTIARSILPLGAALALAACGGEAEEPTYEADAEDMSGGELIVTEEDPDAVPVDTPDTPMTPVPEEGDEGAE
ncbi:hypothetical protein K3162_07325 [Qipengyuania xiapuensis]|uniref:Secreted protein n=1 Tax=Qipengyuania xiapuensis TaxID=2867236 RepID=A0ABX8ZQU5_9SPHN|nr:hypothetical protein [Qipengyuania xiapuensis]QZD91388.1 hypothetical protein K3162_07325 [Qipengyuania xiapuensis]